MKLLFVICEGPHDAQFIGRLLQESGKYKSYDEPLKNYPSPLKEFISGRYNSLKIDEISIGRPKFPLVPICVYKMLEGGHLVLPVSMGGMDKHKLTIEFVEELYNSFASDVLRQSKSEIKSVSFLFIYDADSRGVDNTQNLFIERYSKTLTIQGDFQKEQWAGAGSKYALYIFTGDDGDTGTLEDNLLMLFRINNKEWVNACDQHIQNRFEAMAHGGDETAHIAKINKAILTTCGQIEKVNAGYALTVVVRDTKLLQGAINFTDQQTPWSKLLNLINGAF